MLHELLFVAAKSARPVENRNAVEEFTARLDVFTFDADAAGQAGEIRAAPEQDGRSIGSYDLLIVGQVRSRGLVVVTVKLGAFQRVEGLR